VARLLVLGANGFVGSHLVDSLAAQGHDIRAFDRFRSGGPRFNETDKVEVFQGDYLNRADVKRALEGVEYVFHFISTTTPATAEDDPTIDIETNVRMSVELFKLCVEANVKRVIFASTGGAIYGNDGDSFKETDTPYPVSPYAIGKLTIEHYLRYFRVKHKLDSIVLRISNPYGERQPFHRKQGVIPIFLEKIARDKPITVLGDGSMIRDYMYVKDLTDTVASIFDADAPHDTYNLGSGRGMSVNDIVDIVSNITGKKPLIEYQEVPSTFTQRFVLDTTRFEEDFGRKIASTSLEEGVRATYQYIIHAIRKENGE
jgi:UDP-glucose 4-epimerase